MRRFMKVIQVKRHAVYAVVQDGERGFFLVMRWDPSQLSAPRQVGGPKCYTAGDEEDKRKARAKAYAVAFGMAEYAGAGLDDSRRSDISRMLAEAEADCQLDYRARKAAAQLEAEAPALSPAEALELDRKASEAAQSMAAEEQESAKAASIQEEMSPEALRRPAPKRRP